MIHHRSSRLLQGLAAVLTLVVSTSVLVAQNEVTTYTPSRIQWQELSYRASKLGIKADSEITIGLYPTSEIAPSLIEPKEGTAIEATGEQVARIVIESTVRGRTRVMELTVDPENAAAYQRTLTAPGKEHTLFRTFRYTTDGVFVLRQEGPPNGSGEPSSWPVTNERTIPYPADLGDVPVTEAGALFYILAAGDFKQVGDQLTFYNFDRDGMSQVKLTVEEMTTLDVDYTEVSPSGERRVRANHEVARLSVSGKSVGEGEEAFSFLGLTGSIEIFADPELRVPVAVRGKIPKAGTTTVGLDRMVVK